jgi:DNA-binding cell septation regulator SpoVG
MEGMTTRYQVQVFDMQRFTDKGNLKAFADVKIGKSLKIMGFRIVQQPNQAAWVSPPQRTWQDKEGKQRYSPIVELSGDLKAEVDEAVLAEWAKE